jgi:hypothetical protein
MFRNVLGCTLLMAMCVCQLSGFWCTAETRWCSAKLLARRLLPFREADHQVIALVGAAAGVAGLGGPDLLQGPAGIVGLAVGDPGPGDLLALMGLVQHIGTEPRPARRVGAASGSISRLNPTPHSIAVYASTWSSPSTPQHSLPGGRYSLPGPDLHRLDRASFAWRTTTSSTAPSPASSR